MVKKKLERFAEMKTFEHVVEPLWEEVYNKDYKLKGNWAADFFGNDKPIVLELGCGKGEYTIGLAELYPEKNFIGIDIKGARMWKGAKYADQNGIKNVAFLRSHIEVISSFFAKDEISEIWITFPDPQIKKQKKRLSSARFLNLYKEFLKPEGLVHLKTDSVLLHEFTMDLVKLNKLGLEFSSKDLYAGASDDKILSIKTFYESQYLSYGLKITYMKFFLNADLIQDPEENEELVRKEIEERQLTRTNQIKR